MSMFRRRLRHDVPALNTASLPDLIFTVLFFFMIVTHMRQVTLKVQYQVPAGTELTKLTKKEERSILSPHLLPKNLSSTGRSSRSITPGRRG